MYELIIAATRRGLFAESNGFCPVAATREMPATLVRRLVALAARQQEELRGASRSQTICACHLPLLLDQRPFHLVSRAVRCEDRDPADSAADSAPRWLFHQFLLDSVGGLPGGPAWLLANDTFWQTSWDLPPQVLEPRKLTGPLVSPQICEQWQRQTGDAGWAGAAIEAVQKQQAFALVVPPGLQPPTTLEMLAEAQSLLEPQQRWRIPLTVSAWIPAKLAGQRWTVVTSGSQDALAAARDPNFVVVDLARKLGPAANRFAGNARSGDWARWQTPRPPASKAEPAAEPAASPLFDETLFASESVSPPLTAATPVSSRQVLYPSFRERVAFPWLKWTTVIGVLLLAGFAIWRGSQVVQSVLLARPEPLAPASLATASETINPNERPLRTATTADERQPSPRPAARVVSTSPAVPPGEPPDADDRLRKSIAAAGLPTADAQLADAEELPVANSASSSPRPAPPPAVKTVASVGQVPEKPLLSAAVANGILTQLREQYRGVVLPTDVAEVPTKLVTLSISRELFPELAFGLATSRHLLPLQPSGQPGEPTGEFLLPIPEPAADQPVTAAVSVVWRETTGAEAAEIQWRWLGKPTPELQNELQGGVFVAWLRREPSVAVGLPLLSTGTGTAQSALTSMRLGLEVGLPHEAKLQLPTAADPDSAARLGWKPHVTGLAVEPADADEQERDRLWIPPFSAGNPTGFFVLDDRRLAERYRTQLAPQPADQNAAGFEQLLTQLQPIQVDLKLEALNQPTPEQPEVRLQLRGLVYMRTMEGSRHSIILQATPHEPKPAKEKEFEARIESELRTWLATGLQLPESVAKTFLDGGFAGKKLNRIAKLDRDTAQVPAAIAEMLYGELESLLHQKIRMEIVRTTIVQMPAGETEISVPVWHSK